MRKIRSNSVKNRYYRFFKVIITIIKEFCKKLAKTTASYICADRVAHCGFFGHPIGRPIYLYYSRNIDDFVTIPPTWDTIQTAITFDCLNQLS